MSSAITLPGCWILHGATSVLNCWLRPAVDHWSPLSMGKGHWLLQQRQVTVAPPTSDRHAAVLAPPESAGRYISADKAVCEIKHGLYELPMISTVIDPLSYGVCRATSAIGPQNPGRVSPRLVSDWLAPLRRSQLPEYIMLVFLILWDFFYLYIFPPHTGWLFAYFVKHWLTFLLYPNIGGSSPAYYYAVQEIEKYGGFFHFHLHKETESLGG